MAHPALISAARETDDVERAAYVLDDPRYAGSDVYDRCNEQTSLYALPCRLASQPPPS